MPVRRCKKCDATCFPDDAGEPVSVCAECGSSDLKCDHPGGVFDRVRQCFVCSSCGETSHRGVSELRGIARERPEFGIQNAIDTTDH
mgnify:CR=1 FL=1